MSHATPPKISDAKITLLNMIRGGLGGCIGATAILPFDIVKTWMQLQSEAGVCKLKVSHALSEIMKTKGVRGYYTGLDSVLVRQFFFSAVRYGLFFNAVDLFQTKLNRSLTLLEKAFISLTVGGLGAIVVNPFDVVMVRTWGDLTVRLVNLRSSRERCYPRTSKFL